MDMAHKFIRKNDMSAEKHSSDMLDAEASKKIVKSNPSYCHRYYANIYVSSSPFTFHIEVAFFPHCVEYTAMVTDMIKTIYAKYEPSTFYDFDGCFAYAVDGVPTNAINNRIWVPSDPSQAALETAWEHCLNGCIDFVNARRLPNATRITEQFKNLIG